MNFERQAEDLTELIDPTSVIITDILVLVPSTETDDRFDPSLQEHDGCLRVAIGLIASAVSSVFQDFTVNNTASTAPTVAVQLVPRVAGFPYRR